MQATVNQGVQWQTVCNLADIQPNTGVCALLGEEQVAIFRIGESDRAVPLRDHLYALSNYDPFSKSHVLSRGILGDRQGVLKVASPIYKQNFNLETGECLDDPSVSVATFPVRVVDGRVELGAIAK